MMRLFQILTLLVVLLNGSLHLYADPVLKDKLDSMERSHPRLLLTDDTVEDMRARVASDSELAKLAQFIVERADELIDAPVLERELEGRRMLHVSRECLYRILYWGVAYQFTGDSKYSRRAEREMITVTVFQDWNPGHFLDVAEMCAALSLGYDWFYHELTPTSRALIRGALIQKAMEASLIQDYWWVGSSNNWNQVCHGGLVMASLVVYEDAPELAHRVIQRALDHIDAGLGAYAPDGAYPEGPSYWGYGTLYSVLMIASFESALGTDFGISDSPGFLASARYLLHAAGPSEWFFNYSDSGIHPGLSSLLYWFADRQSAPELHWRSSDQLARFNAGERSVARGARHLPLVLLWAKNVSERIAPKELSWMGNGLTPVAFHRTSWEDAKASFVAIKGGSPSVNHGHMDIGQFVMESDGVRWAADLGMQSYHGLESIGLDLWGKDRWKVFRLANKSHNVLVVDDQLQVSEGSAPIVHHQVGQEISSTIIDMTDVYAGQFEQARRGVALSRQGVVQIEDQIRTLSKSCEVRWGMVTHAEVSLDGPYRATLHQDGERLHVELLSGGDTAFEIFEIEKPPQDYDAPNPGAKMLGFKLNLNPESDRRIAVALIPGNVSEVEIEFSEMRDW